MSITNPLPGYDAWKTTPPAGFDTLENDRVELSSRWVTARKPHGCDDCGTRIAPGRRYTRTAYLEHGAFETEKLCGRCENRRNETPPEE